ncbi:hypothetical protein AVEN_181224-1, partial [Araneus ventricosus]
MSSFRLVIHGTQIRQLPAKTYRQFEDPVIFGVERKVKYPSCPNIYHSIWIAEICSRHMLRRKLGLRVSPKKSEKAGTGEQSACGSHIQSEAPEFEQESVDFGLSVSSIQSSLGCKHGRKPHRDPRTRRLPRRAGDSKRRPAGQLDFQGGHPHFQGHSQRSRTHGPQSKPHSLPPGLRPKPLFAHFVEPHWQHDR